MKNSIILDNGSTLSLFSNPKLVEDIRTSKMTLELATNAGTSQSSMVAEVPGFGTVWYDASVIANIFGLSDLKKKFRITYDSEKRDAFLVHMVGKIIKYECNPKGLYHYKVLKKYIEDIAKNTSLLISTMSKN